MSTLLKYFNHTKTEGSSLPDPSGPLSKKVPATSIEEANKKVDACSSRSSNGGKRRTPYVIVMPEQKARVGSTQQKKELQTPYAVFPRICQT